MPRKPKPPLEIIVISHKVKSKSTGEVRDYDELSPEEQNNLGKRMAKILANVGISLKDDSAS
ncbi:hypothetical protein [Brevibacillus laterosporus]|uniref:hypothetical protein n=1 Tax=Brevibacillus laterosporus TaxID=1465 RepID=UPI003D19781C